MLAQRHYFLAKDDKVAFIEILKESAKKYLDQDMIFELAVAYCLGYFPVSPQFSIEKDENLVKWYFSLYQITNFLKYSPACFNKCCASFLRNP